jgi:hypothetical protein
MTEARHCLEESMGGLQELKRKKYFGLQIGFILGELIQRLACQ